MSSTKIFEEWAELQQLERYDLIPPEIAAPFDDQRERFNARIAQIIPLFIVGKHIEIYLDYFTEGSCNAKAGIYRDIGLVGIHAGAIMLPLEAFRKMFAHPRVLPDIGDSSREKEGAPHQERWPTDYNLLIQSRRDAGQSVLPIQPNDPLRASVAQICVELVWGFLMMHELVHILHGHLGYLFKKMPVSIPVMLNAIADKGNDRVSGSYLRPFGGRDEFRMGGGLEIKRPGDAWQHHRADHVRNRSLRNVRLQQSLMRFLHVVSR